MRLRLRRQPGKVREGQSWWKGGERSSSIRHKWEGESTRPDERVPLRCAQHEGANARNWEILGTVWDQARLLNASALPQG